MLLCVNAGSLEVVSPFGQFSTTYTAEIRSGILSIHNNDEFEIRAFKASEASDRCYIFTLGTGKNFDALYWQVFIKDMASNGFCATTVEYPESTLLQYYTSDFAWKAKSIYNNNRVGSAVWRLEAASEGACSCKHVVAHGFSQGAHIATLSANYNDRVTGILLFSGQCQTGLTFNGGSADGCELLAKKYTAISKDKIREIAAQNDGLLGYGPLAVGRTSLCQAKIVTGANCDADAGRSCDWAESSCDAGQCVDQCKCDNFENSCLQEAANEDLGGGYYIIKNSAYKLGRAHEWFKDEAFGKQI